MCDREGKLTIGKPTFTKKNYLNYRLKPLTRQCLGTTHFLKQRKTIITVRIIDIINLILTKPIVVVVVVKQLVRILITNLVIVLNLVVIIIIISSTLFDFF